MKTPQFRGKEIDKDDVLAALEKFDQEVRMTIPKKRWKT
jgi:hypothetical protein